MGSHHPGHLCASLANYHGDFPRYTPCSFLHCGGEQAQL